MTLRRCPATVFRDQSLAAIDLGGGPVDYLLKRSSARRTLSLRVDVKGRVQVNAPWTAGRNQIDAFLRQHAAWLQAQLARRRPPHVWHDGMPLPLLGREIQLDWRPTTQRRSIVLADDRLVCETAEAHLGRAVVTWYRGQAERHFAERLSAVCMRLGRGVPVWRLADGHSRWGCLSAKGVVGLNWRLVKAGVDEIDYVICHELAHFRHRDHSPAFWREVAALHPGYEAMRQRLHQNASHYLAF